MVAFKSCIAFWLVTVSCTVAFAAAQASGNTTGTGVVPWIPNWVGPQAGRPKDTACYRKTHLANSDKVCPTGFTFDNIAACWAQCPIEYPVRCGMECLPQNEDCTKEVLHKIASVGKAVVNTATVGFFGEIVHANKLLSQGVHCGQELFLVLDRITDLLVEFRRANPQTTKQEIQWALTKSDHVVTQLPRAIAICLGRPAPDTTKAEQVAVYVKQAIEKVLALDEPKAVVDPTQPQMFVAFANGLMPNQERFTDKEVADIMDFVKAGAKCGSRVEEVIQKIITNVQSLKISNPNLGADAIRVVVATSNLVMKDLPAASLGCIRENAPDGYQTRDQILKSARMIVDKVVSAADSQNGKPLSVEDYALAIADLGLDVLARFDTTGLARLAQDFVQPICGPSSFLGDIDDGSAEKALALKTIEKAFDGSSGQWTKKGDGKVRIVFESSDTYPVGVGVNSGGYAFHYFRLDAGGKLVWEKPLEQLQDKTLYLNLLQTGLFHFKRGDGSLALWVPHIPSDGSGGHLELNVKINPTGWRDFFNSTHYDDFGTPLDDDPFSS